MVRCQIDRTSIKQKFINKSQQTEDRTKEDLLASTQLEIQRRTIGEDTNVCMAT